MKRILVSIILFVFMFSALGLAQKTEKRDVNLLITSNGFGAAVFSTVKKKIVGFLPSIYKKYDEKSPETPYLLRSLDYKITINDKSFFISQSQLKSVNYIPGTGIIKASFSHEIANVNIYIFSSFKLDYPNFIVKLEISPNEKGIIEITRSIGYSGKEPISAYDNDLGQYINFLNYGNLNFYFKEVAKKDIEFSLYDIVVLGKDFEESSKLIKYYMNEFFDPLTEELNFWENWHREGKYPKNLTKDYLDLYKQSLAFIKMGQVREKGKGYGQILASLPTGVWNIAWVRDGIYSIISLIKSGHFKEAKEGLEFFLNADSGYYKSYKIGDTDYGVGTDYKISVCRYYGCGKEESDDNGQGPNIELDGFGMFLWAFSEYVKASKDTEFFNKYWEIVDKYVVYPLILNIDTNLGVIRPESGPWERHLKDNGYDGAKRFTYTTIMAIKGLNEINELLKAMKKESINDIAKSIEILKNGLLNNLVDKDKNILVGSYEHFKLKGYPKYLDGSVVEAINFELIPKEISKNTLEAIEKELKPDNREGYIRNLDGGWYDSQEWVIINLRTASAYKKLANTSKANKIVERIITKALNNFYMIPELLESKTDSYKGAIPMLGFGAGALVIYLSE
jgi:GH15 family glucan-1,4-alpha-glucosidase